MDNIRSASGASANLMTNRLGINALVTEKATGFKSTRAAAFGNTLVVAGGLKVSKCFEVNDNLPAVTKFCI